VFVVQLPAHTDRDETIQALAKVGIQSKPYLPAIHLLSFHRKRVGRDGAFPVCEAVAGRSLALPFFPEMTESHVSRVVAALAAATRQDQRHADRAV
jgi:perosamine synthetase